MRKKILESKLKKGVVNILRKPSRRPVTAPSKRSVNNGTNVEAASGTLKDDINAYLQSISKPELRNTYNEPEYDLRESTSLSYEKVVSLEFDMNTDMYDVGSNEGVFPGMIVKLDNKFGTSTPTEINFGVDERMPLTIVSTLPGATSFEVNRTTRADFQSERDKLVDSYLSNSANKGNHDLRAEWEYKEIKSEEHLKATLNVAASSVKFDTEYSRDTTKNYVLGVYRQAFYRLQLDSTYNEPSDFFTNKCDLNILKKGLDNKPAGIVKWVDYGRMYYVLFKSSKTVSEMKAALSYSTYAEAKSEYKKTLEEMECKVILIGGDTKSVSLIKGVTTAKNMDEVYKNIEEYSRMAKDNRGVPIALQVDLLRTPMEKVSVISSGKSYKKTAEVKEVGIKICHDNSTITNYYIRYMNPSYNNSTKSLEWQYKGIKESFNSSTGDKIVMLPARARFINIVVCQQGISDSKKYSIVLDNLQIDNLLEENDGTLYLEFHATGALWKQEYYLKPSQIQETRLMDLSDYSLYEDKDKADECFGEGKYTVEVMKKNGAKYGIDLNQCYSVDKKYIIVEKALEQIFEKWMFKAQGF